MGTNTDPYQPVESEMKITRQILDVLREFDNPVGIVTKCRSSRATSTSWATWPNATWPRRVSITTLDKDLARAMEPRARRRTAGWRRSARSRRPASRPASCWRP